MTRKHLLPLFLVATPLVFTVCVVIQADNAGVGAMAALVLLGFWCMGAAFNAECRELEDDSEENS